MVPVILKDFLSHLTKKKVGKMFKTKSRFRILSIVVIEKFILNARCSGMFKVFIKTIYHMVHEEN